MANTFQLQGPNFGQETTIELARRQKYSATTIAGFKRTYDQTTGHEQQAQSIIAAPQYAWTSPALPSIPQPRLRASRISSNASEELNEGPATTEYSQKRAAHSTPDIADNPLLSLYHPRYGLPKSLVKNFQMLGVNSIYPWQSSCLIKKGLLKGEQNLIYTAPTGGGKSLVADVLLLKKIIECPTKKGILVLPYVALVQEKLKWLRKVVEGVTKNVDMISGQTHALNPQSNWRQLNSSIRVAGFFGGSRAKATWADIDVAVCTIEKANSLVNSAIEEGKLNQLGVVVLDELHMLDDENHGYIMELMITKVIFLDSGIQIIGMSATLLDPKLLADWLKAKFYRLRNTNPSRLKNFWSTKGPSIQQPMLRTSSELQVSLLLPMQHRSRLKRCVALPNPIIVNSTTLWSMQW